jgi:transcriptional regulator with XRE-family HTH domain
MAITGNQLKAARALAGLDQNELADLADVGVNTIRNMESAGPGNIRARTDTLDAVVSVLTRADIVFTNGDHAGVRVPKDRAYGYLWDREGIVGFIKNGELRSTRDGSLVALVKDNQIRDLETAEVLCEIGELGLRGATMPDALRAKLNASNDG